LKFEIRKLERAGIGKKDRTIRDRISENLCVWLYFLLKVVVDGDSKLKKGEILISHSESPFLGNDFCEK